MSINAIRALVLFANVLLIGIIGYTGYTTFYYVDPERWEVIPPDFRRYAPPEIEEDERQKEQQLYKVIGKAFDPPPPPPAPEGPKAEPLTADPRRLEVGTVNYNMRDPALSSALLKGPLAREPRFFMPGQDLGAGNLGFDAYKGVKVKAITETEVILIDRDGQTEVRLPSPRQAASAGTKEPR
jgi:hypothetical protein